MACTLITAPAFPLLQARLLTDLRGATENSAFAPKWVVVPSATLANHLRVQLAQAAAETAFAGVRVVNLPRFVQRLCASLGVEPGLRWNPMLDLLLCEMVQQLGNRSVLGQLREISGGSALLRLAFKDLAEAGFGTTQLGVLEDLAADEELSETERETLRLHAQWVRLLEERNVFWEPLAQQRLPARIEEAGGGDLNTALACEQGQEPQILLYGFYEWTDVNLEWIAALSKRVTMTIYYPWSTTDEGKAHQAFSFAQSVLDDLRGRLGSVDEQALEETADETARYFLSTFPEGDIGECPSFLTHQRATGIRAEAISAAVRIRKWLDEGKTPIHPEDILVVAPQAEEYVEAVQDVFAAFRIPLRVSDVAAGPTPDAEPLRLLARVWEEQAPAEWLLALLRATPDIPTARSVDIDSFEKKVRELGIWGGAAWRVAVEEGDFETQHEEEQRRKIQFDEGERSLINEILEFVPGVGASATSRVSIQAALKTLRLMRDRWVTDVSKLAPLIDAAEAVGRENPGLSIELRQWAQWLSESGGAMVERDPLSRAVLFVPLMRARGLTARAVVVLGLAAGQLPFRVADDPLFSDVTSAKLAKAARDIGHRLPLKTSVTEEMLLLFFLVNSAAGRVHWVVPETDALGKAVAPTPWVQRYLQRWGRKDAAKKTADPFAHRVARSPFVQALSLAELDPERGSLLPPLFALFVNPTLAARCAVSATETFLLESVAKRGKEPAWSGVIAETPKFRDDTIGVTRLEALARCPFRFYAQTVARWEPLEALSLSHYLDALTRGTLLHRLLELSLKTQPAGSKITEIAQEMLADSARGVWKLAEKLPRLEPDAAFALAMLPPLFQQAAMRDVVKMGIAFFEWAQERQAVPQETEGVFKQPFPGLAGADVVGKIDLIEVVNGATEVTDFKSGKRPGDYRKLVKLGWQIQAALYPWLCGNPNAGFRYVYLGRHCAEEGDAKDSPPAERLLRDLAPIITDGSFVPTSNQVMEELGLNGIHPCRYCHFISACRRFERGAAQQHAKLFAKLAPQRIQSLGEAVGKNKTTVVVTAKTGAAKSGRGKKSK